MITIWNPMPLVTTCHVFLDDPGEAHCEATTEHLARQLVDPYDAPPPGPMPSAIVFIHHAHGYATIDAAVLQDPVPNRPSEIEAIERYEEIRAAWIEAFVVHQAFETAFQDKYACLIV